MWWQYAQGCNGDSEDRYRNSLPACLCVNLGRAEPWEQKFVNQNDWIIVFKGERLERVRKYMLPYRQAKRRSGVNVLFGVSVGFPV